ncbi:hypothetical protein [Bosea sp. (in: a-proteobacteria)]|uniref:hypothetical protein n=1 Tax=Bosea sp. (in: a-proteobacteria) TaxID=1871050 RepID=UPI00263390AF|nr:hypothetical protein [Bosea sp. (in: a-proteobacteria)]MCO5092364.1 hypothetical protein [Bosea sp. (in: a-proteobacteria)]
MLTAVIRGDGSPEALAATLSILIPAVAEGLLGHAVIVDTAGTLAARRTADATGAHYLRADPGRAWQDGAAHARGERLVLFDAGDAPQAHWVQVVERHLSLAPQRPGLIPLSGIAASLRERVLFALGGRGLRPGLVLPRTMAAAGRLDRAPVRLPVLRERAG